MGPAEASGRVANQFHDDGKAIRGGPMVTLGQRLQNDEKGFYFLARRGRTIEGSKPPRQRPAWGWSGFGLAWRGTGRLLNRRKPAHGIADNSEVVGTGRITALMGLDGAMDFEVDNCVKPIAPELSGAA